MHIWQNHTLASAIKLLCVAWREWLRLVNMTVL
jgi:hypothetical protein